MAVTLTRRALLLGLAALPTLARAEDVLDLEWKDLLPGGVPDIEIELRGLIEHDEAAQMSIPDQPVSTGVRTDLNGQIVRLSGFIIPLDFSGTGVTAFMLVPYVGACIHVPPPPANQLVFVTTGTPFESEGLYAPVTVTGMFGAASTSTQLAEIGYALSADKIEAYKG